MQNSIRDLCNEYTKLPGLVESNHTGLLTNTDTHFLEMQNKIADLSAKFESSVISHSSLHSSGELQKCHIVELRDREQRASNFIFCGVLEETKSDYTTWGLR